MFLRLFLFIALIATTSLASGIELEGISDDLDCYPEYGVGEHGWFTHDVTRDEGTCIFAQFPRGKPEHPYIRVQGKNVILSHISVKHDLPGPWKTEEIFANQAAKLTVRLGSYLSHDSCVEGEEKCCGQEYEGFLEVTDPTGSKVYKVRRWSGG
jgi:hypothetical protein